MVKTMMWYINISIMRILRYENFYYNLNINDELVLVNLLNKIANFMYVYKKKPYEL